MLTIQSNNTVYLGKAKPITQEDISVSWRPHAQWPEIRSGALPNSVYFLVGHSADYSTYPQFSVQATLSTAANSYEVYVDGVKQATTASGSSTTLVWQTLALSTGTDVTYPAALRTHVVRVTPAVGTDTISAIKLVTNTSNEQGVLWVHTTCANAVNYQNFLSPSTTVKCLLCEAFTGAGGVIYFSNFYNSLRNCTALKHLDILDGKSGSSVSFSSGFAGTAIKKLRLRNFTVSTQNYDMFNNMPYLQEICAENVVLRGLYGNMFVDCPYLKQLPCFSSVASFESGSSYRVVNCPSLADTFLDLSYITSVPRILIYGTSAKPMRGIKGVVLSTSMTINGTSSPQINLEYTGLNKAALVALFNSLPTVEDGQVCDITGATGAADLEAADLAIATEKGWTITR